MSLGLKATWLLHRGALIPLLDHLPFVFPLSSEFGPESHMTFRFESWTLILGTNTFFFVHLLAGWLACRTWEAPAAAKPIGSVMVTPSSTCLPWAWSYWMNILSSLEWNLAHLGTPGGLGWWSPMTYIFFKWFFGDRRVSPTNKALVWRAHAPGVRQCEMASDESMTQVKQDRPAIRNGRVLSIVDWLEKCQGNVQ